MSRNEKAIRQAFVLVWETDDEPLYWGVEGCFEHIGRAMEYASEQGVPRDGWTVNKKTEEDYRHWTAKKIDGLYWTILVLPFNHLTSKGRSNEELRTRHDPGFMLLRGRADGDGMHYPERASTEFLHRSGEGSPA